MILLREAEYLTVPWKNGGGWTKEILKVPAEANTFAWRLSLATIENAGPFSAFTGYDRTLILVRGAGVELDFGPHGRTVLNAPGQSAAFDGAWQTQCTLIDGPSSDLNLMVSREQAEADARLMRLTAPEIIRTAGWDETLVCCIHGNAHVEDTTGYVAELASVDVARCQAEDGTLTCAPVDTTPVVLFVASLRRRGTSNSNLTNRKASAAGLGTATR
jgi:environmental stress-induced protein Ves